MPERKTFKGFFEFLVSGEVARLLMDGVGRAALGPFGVAIPVASRAIEYYGPAVIRQAWLFLSGRPKAEAALICEEIANLDAHTAWEAAEQACNSRPDLTAIPEAERKYLSAVLAAIPAGLRQMLPRRDDGRSTCPVEMLPRTEAELLRGMPLAVPPLIPPCELSGTDYLLEEIVGTGGFGTVYRARLKTEYAPRAIKVPSDPTRVESLRNELKTLQRLIESGGAWSRRIVRLYGHRLDREPAFLVYEYVPDGDLAQYVREHRRRTGHDLTPNEVISLVHEIAECLAIPHKAGISHRDLKPSNLLKGADGWKLADFGLGASVDLRPTRTDQQSSVARSQELRGAGTPLYMCEEQRRGESPDPRHDVYSLGVIWYQMLICDFSRRLTPEWDENLRDHRVPEEHVLLIGRCIRGLKSRPADGRALIDEIDGRRQKIEIEQAKRNQILAQQRAERARIMRKVQILLVISAACGCIVGAAAGRIGHLGTSGKLSERWSPATLLGLFSAREETSRGEEPFFTLFLGINIIMLTVFILWCLLLLLVGKLATPRNFDYRARRFFVVSIIINIIFYIIILITINDAQISDAQAWSLRHLGIPTWWNRSQGLLYGGAAGTLLGGTIAMFLSLRNKRT